MEAIENYTIVAPKEDAVELGLDTEEDNAQQTTERKQQREKTHQSSH